MIEERPSGVSTFLTKCCRTIQLTVEQNIQQAVMQDAGFTGFFTICIGLICYSDLLRPMFIEHRLI